MTDDLNFLLTNRIPRRLATTFFAWFSRIEQPIVRLDRSVKYKGPNRIRCAASFLKGDEMGYFSHGSTIIVFATAGLDLCENVKEGAVIRMGQPLLRLYRATARPGHKCSTR